MAQDKEYQPFYSEVHPDIVEELAFRASCGISDKRTDEQLEWITSRTSWGSITILQTDENGKDSVLGAINNQSLAIDNNPTIEGTFFRGTRGIIKDATNRFNAYKNQITNFTSGVRSLDATDPEYLAKNYINTVSGRPGPSLQGMTFTLIDSATGTQGLLNEAKVEILVPDVEYFINEFEPIWFRLNSKCVLEVGHSVRLDRRPNYGRYVGRLTNFSFEYNSDASVSVSLSFKTTTDLATIQPHSAITKEQSKANAEGTEFVTLGDLYYSVLNNIAAEVLPSNTNNNICHVFEPSYIEKYYNLQINGAGKDNSIASMEAELRDHLSHEIKRFRLKKPKKTDDSESTYDIFMARIKMDSVSTDLETDSKNQGSSGTKVYVSLGMLLKLVTTQILVATKQANIQKDTAFNETINTNLDLIENDSSGWLGAKTDIFTPSPAASSNIQPSSFTRLEPTVITAAPEFCQTLYFEELVSADHTKVILPGSDKYPTDLYFSDKWFKKKSDVPTDIATVIDEKQENGIPIYIGRIQEFTEDTKTRKRDDLDNIAFYSNLASLSGKRSRALRKFVKPFLSETDELEQQLAIDSNDRVFGNPANILISLDVIREIEERELSAALAKASVERAVFDIDIFLSAINKVIKDATGGIIDLNLTTLPSTDVPDVDETKIQFIIYHDVTSSVPEGSVYNTKITTLPMFVNKPIRAYDETGQQIGRTGYQRLGTVVRSFKIVSQIPNSVLAQSFVFSQDSGAIRDMMSNFLAWINSKGNKNKTRQTEEYVSAYQKNLANVRSNKILYSNTPMQDDVKIGLKNALQKYMTTPKEDLKKLFGFTAPVWPVTVEFELDGCYGFRFGDVISITGMPTTYNNFVFTITKTDHTLVKNEWTTKISCMMRPRIEPSSLTSSGLVGKLFPNQNIRVDI